MENKQTICIRTDDAIALCHIIDEFETFNNNFINFLNTITDDISLILAKLYQISNGEKVFGATRIKCFYNENKTVIDKIKKYSSLIEFIFCNYNFAIKAEFSSNYLYQYILENRDKLDEILVVLEKIKELGFETFNFNTQLDFSKETYFIYREMTESFMPITYFDNLEIIPSYEGIRYKTNGSKYMIKLVDILPFGKNKITLNDLTFNVNRLPKSLLFKDTAGKILELSQQRQEEYTVIKNSVDLNAGIKKLYVIHQELNSKFNKIDDIDSKEELLEELKKVKEAIKKMQILSQQYDKKVVSEHETITASLLEEEQHAYTKTREQNKKNIYMCN